MKSHVVGIDLGTTNSAVCLYDGESLRVLKSPEQNDVTPSAIMVDRRGNRYVGYRAFESSVQSPENVAVRFKRLMGTVTPIAIPAAGLTLTPEQCSAEVLRVLFGYLPEEARRAGIGGTVITVPAAFNQMQMEATLAAAELAAIGKVSLLQEPVAAVMSVMRSRASDGRFLVYDLGGGTLDIALAESIGGRVSLLSHGGIAMCGGRDIDRLIVDEIVLPWLHSNFQLPRDLAAHDRYRVLLATAAYAAEKAKIELSSRSEATVHAPEALLRTTDDVGAEIYLDIVVTRQQLDDLTEDLVERSVEAARETITHAGLSSADLERIVFVGGPTQYKPLRDRVAAALGVPASTEVNPMTAVAEGAAVFAEGIDWTSAVRGRKATRGTLETSGPVRVSFNFQARTPSSRAKLAFSVVGEGGKGCETQIDSLESGWSSGRVALIDGAIVEVPLPRQGLHNFKIFVFDESGQPVGIGEDRITITRTAATIDAVPASHSVGVEVLEKLGGETTLEYLVRRGDPLPKKGAVAFRAAESVRSGASNALNFKLWEGEISHPVRDNRFIGAVRISGADVEAGGVIPAGAELQCEYVVEDSGTISVSISVPSIGSTFRNDHNFYSPQEGQVDFTKAAHHIASEAAEVRARVDHIESRVDSEKLDLAKSRLDAAAGAASTADPERAKQALDDVLEAKRLLAEVRHDNLREMREIELEDAIALFGEHLRAVAKASEVTSYDNLVASARRVIGRSDGAFETYLDEMSGIRGAVFWRQDWFVVDRFRDLCNSPELFADAAQFAELVRNGEEAVRTDDMQGLRRVVGELLRARRSFGGGDDRFDGVNLLRG